MLRLSKYGLQSQADFDKYTAVSMAEAASMEAHHTNDLKASFLEAACQTLRVQLNKPTDKFQAYFLASFSDKDYTKVLECIAKVDKAFKRSSSSATTPSRSPRSLRVVCFFFGSPGHVVSTCFHRRQKVFKVGLVSTPVLFHTPGVLLLVLASALTKDRALVLC